MRVELIPGRNLTAAHVERWREIQRADESLHSPFFAPQFLQAVAAEVKDVFVGVIRGAAGDRVIGFFPFQRERFGAAWPVGFPIADQHGLIAEAGAVIGALQLLRACGIGLWKFEYVPASQSTFVPHMTQRHVSPVADLHDYSPPKGELRKITKLEREAGRLRFEVHSADPQVLRALVNWKREQYARTNFPDIFQQPWAGRLIERLHRTQDPEFAGVLSALYAGDELVAAHFGLRSRTAWHWWFPSYDSTWSACSPGMVLLLKMIEQAPSLGIDLLDFGAGDELFKRRFATRSIELASGAVRASTLTMMAEAIRQKTTRAIVHSGLERPARAVYRALRRT